jgi:hypothetical protein
MTTPITATITVLPHHKSMDITSYEEGSKECCMVQAMDQ